VVFRTKHSGNDRWLYWAMTPDSVVLSVAHSERDC